MSRILNRVIFDRKLSIVISIRTQHAASNIESLKRRRWVAVIIEGWYGIIYRTIENL